MTSDSATGSGNLSNEDGAPDQAGPERRIYHTSPRYEPPPMDARLWRYLDLARLVSILDSRALYFPNALSLGDPFEGTYTRANVALRPDVYRDDLPMMWRFYRAMTWMRAMTYISCWHENPYESAAMWAIYGRDNRAVALQTTFERLAACFGKELPPGMPDNIHHNVSIGRVRYVDYDEVAIPENNTLFPFLHKRTSFEHEREVRVIASRRPGSGPIQQEHADQAPAGISVAVDPDTLLERIYVAPQADPWFADLVREIVRRWGLQVPVQHSDLSQDPVL